MNRLFSEPVLKNGGETITFKSLPRLYRVERDGLKCNTVRVIPPAELSRHKMRNTEFIEIINCETGESFRRKISHIVQFYAYQEQILRFYKGTDAEGLYDGSVWIISWQHSQGDQ